jgi:hypothetical protein
MPENLAEGRDIRVKVPAKLWAILEEVAKTMGVPAKTCLALLFQDLEHMAESDEIGAIGYRYAQAAKRAQEQREYERDQARATDPDLIKLHRSDKTKSGFVGVYSNGKGFRAEGRDPVNRKGAVTLGTFRDAESAALARLKHYKRYGMPYGQLEALVEQFRERYYKDCNYSDARIKHEVIWSYANNSQQPLPGLTPEERALERIPPSETP